MNPSGMWNHTSRPQFQRLTLDVTSNDGNSSLKEYQKEGVNWLFYCWTNRINNILADEMGLGKTIQTIALLNHLFTELNLAGPYLILCPLTLLANWKSEFEKWGKMKAQIYAGSRSSRDLARQVEFGMAANSTFVPPFHFNVLITTYEIFGKDFKYLKKIEWQYVVIDEAIRAFRCGGIDAKLLLTIKDHLSMLIGIPIQNNVREFATLLHVLDPIAFSSVEALEQNFSLQDANQINELQSLLRSRLLRRLKADVENSEHSLNSLPQETVIELELSPIQRKYYSQLLEVAPPANTPIPGLLSYMLQLTKCCNHPYLLPNIECEIISQCPQEDVYELMIKSSCKLNFVDKLLEGIKDSSKKVAIISQQLRVLDILEDFLSNKKQYIYERIDGSKNQIERMESITKFTSNYNSKVLLLTARSMGLGFSSVFADLVVVFDSDYQKSQNLLIKSRKTIRLVCKDTIECAEISVNNLAASLLNSLATNKKKRTEQQEGGLDHQDLVHLVLSTLCSTNVVE